MSKAESKYKPTAPPEGATLLTIPEVAHELRCSVATIYREIGSGKLVTRKVRGKTYVHREDIAAYIEAARQELRPAADAASEKPSHRLTALIADGLVERGEDFGYRPARKG